MISHTNVEYGASAVEFHRLRIHGGESVFHFGCLLHMHPPELVHSS
jgi:hypothetical protein